LTQGGGAPRRARWVSDYAHVPRLGRGPRLLLDFATPDTQRARLLLEEMTTGKKNT